MIQLPILVSMIPVSPKMRARLEPQFIVLEANGHNVPWASVTHVLTIGEIGLPDRLLERCPELKLVVCNSVGYDKLNLEALTARGVRASNAADTTSHAVASLALGLILASYRDILRNHMHVKTGAWAAGDPLPLSRDIRTDRIGLVGMGNIGQKIAEFLTPLNPDISYYSRSVKNVPYTYIDSLSVLADRCDLLICVVPGGLQHWA